MPWNVSLLRFPYIFCLTTCWCNCSRGSWSFARCSAMGNFVQFWEALHNSCLGIFCCSWWHCFGKFGSQVFERCSNSRGHLIGTPLSWCKFYTPISNFSYCILILWFSFWNWMLTTWMTDFGSGRCYLRTKYNSIYIHSYLWDIRTQHAFPDASKGAATPRDCCESSSC